MLPMLMVAALAVFFGCGGGTAPEAATAPATIAAAATQPGAAVQYLLGIRGQRLQLCLGALRRRDLDELDLVKLVLADQTPHVLAVGARLRAKAGGEGRVVQR